MVPRYRLSGNLFAAVAMHLTLQFLGSFKAQLNDDIPLESRAKKIEALLAYLAIESDRAHRRESLVGLLFPEVPEEQARTNLRQTLTRLRRAINDKKSDPPFLLITRESTQFNLDSDHFLDVESFIQHLGGCPKHRPDRDRDCEGCIQELITAVQLYHGPFLDGFSLDDSAAFEDWIAFRREQYKGEVQAALQDLADFYERRGAYAVATDYVRRQIRLETWNEEAHQQLMRLLAYQGQRAAALQQYQTVKRILENELAVEPMAETQSLYARIRAARNDRPFQLPPRHTNFMGREQELALLNEYLADKDKQLITIMGLGGSGKTAIATETGWRVATRFLGPFYDGVFFVSLMGIRIEETDQDAKSLHFDPFVTAVAEAIGFSFSGQRHPREQLLRYLKNKSLLLIVDNVEHVIADIRPFIRDILHEAPGIKILLTSRGRLGFNEEWVLEIEGLPYPGNGQLITGGEHQQSQLKDSSEPYHAVALFENLGKQLLPEFSLSDEINCPAAAVYQIAQLVQGLPLGIELAASWLRTLSCLEIAAEIETSLDFLSSTMEDLPSRHRSMRAVFNSSWQLLNQQEQQTLRRLSVFHGPFTRQAATAVTGASLATLSSLVDHSLLHRQDFRKSPQIGGLYELLDILRQYATEQLEKDEAEASQVRKKHAAFYLQFLNQQRDILQGKEQHQAVSDISENIKQIRSAWQWAAQNHDLDGLSRALDSLGLFYYMRSWFIEGADLFALATAELEPLRGDPYSDSLWGRLRARQGWFTFLLGNQHGGLSQLRESIAVLREADDSTALAFSLNFTAAALAILGSYKEARSLAQEALLINEQCLDAYGCAISNNILSQIAYQEGEYSLAKMHCEASLAYEKKLDNRWSIGFSLTNLGRVAYAQKSYEEALDYFQQSLAIRQALKDSRGQALCLRYLGETAHAQGWFEQGQQYLEESLAIFQDIGSQDETSATLNSLGILALDRQEERVAQQYFVEALQIAKMSTNTPRILDAEISLARLLTIKDPVEAARIAFFIQDHPAANRNSRGQAAKLIDELRQKNPQELADVDQGYESLTDIDPFSDNLLALFLNESA
jgi:DNA-binding SARP family transcriptional activator/predicted ATPase